MPASILVADDDKAMLRLYSRIFSETDYTISMAETFEQASRMIRRNDYDLLVTDLMFPDGLGTELIKIREKKNANAKSLLVTGLVGPQDALKRAGISEYFEKPFKLEPFLSAVKKALGV